MGKTRLKRQNELKRFNSAEKHSERKGEELELKTFGNEKHLGRAACPGNSDVYPASKEN